MIDKTPCPNFWYRNHIFKIGKIAFFSFIGNQNYKVIQKKDNLINKEVL